MTEHDPFALLDGADLPLPTPWESLAQQARWLADYAEHLATREPAHLVPDPDEDDDPLSVLEARALGVRSVAAACRRDTYRRLRESMTTAQIAAAFDISPQAVHKSLAGGSGKKAAS